MRSGSSSRTIPVADGKIKLSSKEFIFADGILRGLGNIQACREAGYLVKSDQGMAVAAQRLLNNPNIKEYIRLEVEQKEATRRKNIEVDDIWVTEQFKEIYNRCMQRIPVMRFDNVSRQMVQEVDEEGEGVWTFDSSGANRALENIAKHIGYFELDNKQRAPIINIGIVQNVQTNLIIQPQQNTGDAEIGEHTTSNTD